MAPILSPVEEFGRSRTRTLQAMRAIIRLARESQAEIAAMRSDQFTISDLKWAFTNEGPVELFARARVEYDQALLRVYDKVNPQSICDRCRDQWQDDQGIFDELEELMSVLRRLFNAG